MLRFLLIPLLAVQLLAEPFLRPQIVLQPKKHPSYPIEWIAPPPIPPPGTTPVLLAWTGPTGWKVLRPGARLVVDLAAGTIDAAQQSAPQVSVSLAQVDLVPNTDGSLWSLPATAPDPAGPLAVHLNGVLVRAGVEYQMSGTRSIVPVLSAQRPAWRFSDDQSLFAVTAVYLGR